MLAPLWDANTIVESCIRINSYRLIDSSKLGVQGRLRDLVTPSRLSFPECPPEYADTVGSLYPIGCENMVQLMKNEAEWGGQLLINWIIPLSVCVPIQSPICTRVDYISESNNTLYT